MRQGAIGMIETFGLIAAVEGLDACLKAANVTIASFKYVSGGLVMLTVTGDVGAVRAAVEAGVAAAKKVGHVLSSHVIARPHAETELLITPPEKPGGRKRETGIHKRDFPAIKPENEPETQPDIPKIVIPIEEQPSDSIEMTQDEGIAAEQAVTTTEQLKEDETETTLSSENPILLPQSEPTKPSTKKYTREQLEQLRTIKLRDIARHTPGIGMGKLQIRDGKKTPLIEAILKAQEV